ncbi:hypothetical protein OUZ56_027776 [Daphnia magna]|uniref:Uncharacterized protein n=1 Tax=Daphnia magna TaxID=35525 RepID=A0ABR0B1X0_9CRUS|nr:hypothetical protein OUZ56_027776 [Daphnia magna]
MAEKENFRQLSVRIPSNYFIASFIQLETYYGRESELSVKSGGLCPTQTPTLEAVCYEALMKI